MDVKSLPLVVEVGCMPRCPMNHLQQKGLITLPSAVPDLSLQIELAAGNGPRDLSLLPASCPALQKQVCLASLTLGLPGCPGWDYCSGGCPTSSLPSTPAQVYEGCHNKTLQGASNNEKHFCTILEPGSP